MISYALSDSAAFSPYMTPALADAFRNSKFQNVEVTMLPFVEESEDALQSRSLTRQLLKEGAIRSASVHLPFFGGGQLWDPSLLDEDQRKGVTARIARLIRDNADIMAPMATLHASHEPPMEEHPARIDQVCRSIEELVPLAEEFNFSINVEYLPRTCIGNCVVELQKIVSRFDSKHVGICFDVNHIMDRYRELPDMITELAPRIRSFHISDYDGEDELHWIPGQGINDWCEVMRRIKAIDHDVLLILETTYQLAGRPNRKADPVFAIRQNENACWFLENCDTIIAAQNQFKIPGNFTA
ncbi:MAG: sugar phosphate isomerase/epimerase [Lentisphaeria bacterium]|nr:sugar phosphate isomerase/epimerase [Lentisphaeria bacterium]